MYNMTEFLYLHKVVNYHRVRLAYAINIVSGKIYEHNMLCPVLFGRAQLFSQYLVLCVYHVRMDHRILYIPRTYPPQSFHVSLYLQ